MATKLKKFSHSLFIKTIVFILMLASLAGMIYTVENIVKTTKGNIEMLFEKTYIESSEFRLDTDYRIYQLADVIDLYKSEEHIKAGKTIDKEELDELTDQAYWERDHEARLNQDFSMDSVDAVDSVVTEEIAIEIREDIKKELKRDMIADDLERFENLVNQLNKVKEPLYYATDGEHTFTNTKATKKADFEKLPVFFVNDEHEWSLYPKEFEQAYNNYGYSGIYRASDVKDTTIFLGYTENYIKTATKEWDETKQTAMEYLYYAIPSLVVFILSFIYLLVTTGRKSFKDETVHLHVIDKIYTDVIVFFFFFIGALGFGLGLDLAFLSWAVYPIILTAVGIGMILFLSLIRHVKNKTIFKHSLIYTVLSFIFRFLNDIYQNGSVGMKVTVIVILYPLLTAATVFFFPIAIGIALWLAMRKVKDFNKIQEGAKVMKDGNLHHRIDVTGKGEFARLAANINGINEGFEQAVHNELKNERMKTELITNVSHDIRTPLTSLITYTDLLKTEKDPEKIAQYIDILDQKSKRLKVLTDDLFAAAKASSGDIPVDLQEIDIVALVNQGIGEVSEQITAKNLDFKFSYPDEKILVKADGKLLWRSIENILTNIFNYALEGSRVYIDIVEQGDDILLTFKNISKYELNITEEELMERFKRGDESRTSQGSGLGLSITKSLIENQQGRFEIDIDGDLFKSIIYLPKED